MSRYSEVFIQEVLLRPTFFYQTPHAVLSDQRLTPDEKKKILQEMELDQMELLEADNENMTFPAALEKPSEKLRAIKKAQIALAEACLSDAQVDKKSMRG